MDMGSSHGNTTGTCLIADQLTAATNYNTAAAATATALTALQAAEVQLCL